MALLKIRAEQMDAFSSVAGGGFEKRAFEWISRQLPRKVKKMGPEKTRALIRKAIPQARRYEFSSEKEVMKYLHLAFLWNDGSGVLREPPYGRYIMLSDLSAEGRLARAHMQFKKEQTQRVKELIGKL